MNTKFRKTIILGAALFALLTKQSALGCAACYGASDSPLAQGMNWGIMVLLGFIGCVLVGISSFFVYIVRRANTVSKSSSEATPTEPKP